MTQQEIIEALRGVKVPGASSSIVDAQLIKGIDLQERSLVLTIGLSQPDPMIEKSLKFQIEKALPQFQVGLEFASSQKPSKPKIGSVIAVGSGKGGVGKSSVTVNLAVAFQRMGYSVGILDCDLYGPSVPTMLNVENQKPFMLNGRVQPIEAYGLRVMSAGFFIEPGQGLIWRGPMIHKLIQQFWNDVDWGDLDILLVDLPPGTGDAPLSLSQVLPLTGALMVSTPQMISLIDVQKAVAMFGQVKVPILGVVENMSVYECANCHHQEAIFDRGRVRDFCRERNLSYLGDIPIDPRIRAGADQGEPFMLAHAEDSVAGKALVRMAGALQPFLRKASEAVDTDLRVAL